ncbi:MAG TPA: SulP family inorganic anion transporter [Steroidobacteraceae bacterium]|jgi:sulfate permease, SulP family|nr:SulP family inorganic anion transporter [Steroidobacteraceae bacterium]
MPLTLFSGLRPIDRRQALRDCLAGVNLASINLPQVLGYARIAGMPVVAGFYTLLLPLVGFAVFGSSRHLVVAADSATAAIIAGSLSHSAVPGSELYVALASLVALLTGGYLLLARIFKLGFLADFLSRTVLVGFLTGVGLQVGIAMLSDMFGIATTSRYSLVRLWQICAGLGQPHILTLALSGFVATAILLGNRFAPRWPLSLVAVVLTIAASNVLHLADLGVAVVGPIAGGFPSIGLPRVSWSEVLSLLPVAGSCFVMIIAQSAATSRAFAIRYAERVDINADMLGLSVANLSAAITGTFVVNGSPTQTALADKVGARSQIAQLVLACVVLLVLLFLTAPLQYLPRCVLASIVFTIAVGMIDFARLRNIRRESPGEYYLAVATAAAVVALGVEQGILLAIALSLFRHVRHSYRPHTMMLEANAEGVWVTVPAQPGKVTEPGLIVYRFGADLFYANQNRFVDEVRALVANAPTPVHALVIDASAITDIDCSAAQSLRDLIGEMARHNVTIVFGRVTSYLKSDLDRHGITAAVGAERIFRTLHEAIAYARGAPPSRVEL